MYRPKDWKTLELNMYNCHDLPKDYFEAGADAMLKLLREQGCPTIDKLGEGPYTLGVSFFIPDDEVSQ